MIRLRKLLIIGVAVPLLAQQPPTPPAAATPQLSTAEKEALTSLEKQKREAYGVIQSTSREEMQIAREFIVRNPGWHLDTATFAVERDPEKPKPPTTPPAKK